MTSQYRVFSFDTRDKSSFEEARKIRNQVFIIEQNVNEDEEFDEFEDESIHYLLVDGQKAIGTARWRRIGNKTKLERFAVLEEYRNKGLGGKLLMQVIKDASETKQDLYMHAQLKAIPFYERQGFSKVGDLFSECDIDHYKMVLPKK